MKISKREQRRAQTLRYQNRQLRLDALYYSFVGNSPITPQFKGKLRTISAFCCGCEMCKNQRRSKWYSKRDRVTIQERKHLLNARDYGLHTSIRIR